MLLHSARIAAITSSIRTFHASAAQNTARVNAVTFGSGETSAQGGVVLG